MSETPDDLLSVVEQGVRAARAAGAEAAEVYVWAARSWEARTAGRLRNVQESEQSGVSVRVAVDGRRAMATASGALDVSLRDAIDRAVAHARLMPRTDRAWILPEPRAAERSVTHVDDALVDPRPDRILGMVQEASDALDRPGLDYAAATVMTHEGRFAVANTNGVLAWDRNAHEALLCEVRGRGQDESRTMRLTLHERRPIDHVHDVAERVRDAATRVEDRRKRAHLDRPVHDIVFDPQCAAQILFGILPSFAGNAANEGRSRFAGRLDEPVASEALTLVDDPTDGVGVRNHRVDDQGFPAVGPLPLIERGILRNHVHDVASAHAAGKPATGHGLRPLNGRYGAPPKTRVSNAVIQPGDVSFEEMIEACPRAVLVEGDLLGSFTMNPLTGDFSCTATLARRIEAGRIVEPLAPVTVGGNVFDAILGIRALGDDPQRFPRGACPTLRVGDGLTAST